jgi:putative membrane protein
LTGNDGRFDPTTITRPDSRLLRYYVLVALLAGPLFPLAFLPLYCKYHTLVFGFDDSGVSLRWGLLFRREIHLRLAIVSHAEVPLGGSRR